MLKLTVAALALLSLSACATVPRAAGPGFPPVGASYVSERRETGSYGSGTTRVTGTALGERTWQGKTVRAYENPEGITLSEPATGRWVAQLKGDKLITSFDPPLGYLYPVEVGKTWTTTHRVTNHVTQQTTDLEATFTVESYEEVTVPAGTFKVFKIRYATKDFAGWQWWNPENGLWVKSRFERLSNNPLGAGTRDTEIVSETLRR